MSKLKSIDGGKSEDKGYEEMKALVEEVCFLSNAINVCRPVDIYNAEEYGVSHLVSIGDGFYHIRVIATGKSIYIPISGYVLESLVPKELNRELIELIGGYIRCL